MQDEPELELVGELVDPEDIPMGETVWVARRLDLLFDARAGASESIVLANGIDASEFASAELVVLLHYAKEWTTDTTLAVGVQAVSLDPIEPDVEFLGPAFELSLTPADSAPLLLVGSLGTPPSMVRVYVTWAPRFEGTDPQFATISVALNFRRHVPPRYVVLPYTANRAAGAR